MDFSIKYPEYTEQLNVGDRRTLREEKAVLFIKAVQPLQVVEVDKKVIPERPNQKMCDYFIQTTNGRDINFIELKGIDMEQACKQILKSIEYFETDRELQEVLNHAETAKGYIVSRQKHVPGLLVTSGKKLQNKLQKISRKRDDPHLISIKCVKNLIRNETSVKKCDHMIVTNDYPLQL